MIRSFCLLAAMTLLLALPAGAAEPPRFKVAIPVFSTGLPTDASTYAEAGVFPRIREIEARYLPFVLRQALAGSNEWGPVRVVADAEVIEDLVVLGDIRRSDATRLEIHIRAVDAAGNAWLDERYSAVPAATGAEPAYQRIFAEVSRDLVDARARQDAAQLARIPDIALLCYGQRLAPATFGQYLDTARDGRVSIRRLPARNDPMLDRITRIREAEYVIIDAADEKYALLHDDVASIYDIWSAFIGKSQGYEAEDRRRVAESAVPGPRGSYDALVHAYDNYKFSRLTAEERDAMAVAFDNEVRPIVAHLDERLATYNAWVEDKYREWNRLLEELNALETRLGD